MESIIAAVITGIIAAAASVFASMMANEKTVAILEERMRSQAEKIDRLEQKQDEANKVKERVAVLERDMKTCFLRIDELKKGA